MERAIRELVDGHASLVIPLQVTLMMIERRRRSAITYPRPPFNYHAFDGVDEMVALHFSAEEINLLMECLGLPDFIAIPRIRPVPSSFALRVCLSRLSHPRSYGQMAQEFHVSPSTISKLVNGILDRIVEKLGVLLYDHFPLVVRERVPRYRDAMIECGCPVGCWSVLDCTARRIRAPSHHFYPAGFYDGHHHYHAIKFLTLIAPDGLFLFSSHWNEGSIADAEVLRRCGLHDVLGAWEIPQQCRVLADSAFASDRFVEPIPRQLEVEALELGNLQMQMASLRVVVEHSYQMLFQDFPILDDPKWLSIGKSDLNRLWFACLGLSNYKTIVRGGNRISDYFRDRGSQFGPPALDQYLD